MSHVLARSHLLRTARQLPSIRPHHHYFRASLRYCSNSEPFDAAIQTLQRQTLANYALFGSTGQPDVISVDRFVALCCASGGSSGGTMSTSEALSHLRALHDARLVAWNESDDLVHLRPSEVLCASQPPSPAVREQSSSLHSGSGALWRKRFWSTVAMYTAVQMAVMSYLVFVKYDWDVMEPASYFLTSLTAMLFFGYFLATRKDHGLAVVDKLLAHKLTRK